MVMASVILGLPAVNIDWRVEDLVVRGKPCAQGCIIVEQLEGRTRLPLGLNRAIVLASGVASSSYHGDNCAIGPHRDERRLFGVLLVTVFGQRRFHDVCR